MHDVEYKILEQSAFPDGPQQVTEIALNELSKQGWRIISIVPFVDEYYDSSEDKRIFYGTKVYLEREIL